VVDTIATAVQPLLSNVAAPIEALLDTVTAPIGALAVLRVHLRGAHEQTQTEQ
jgi:hypothetical protein